MLEQSAGIWKTPFYLMVAATGLQMATRILRLSLSFMRTNITTPIARIFGSLLIARDILTTFSANRPESLPEEKRVFSWYQAFLIWIAAFLSSLLFAVIGKNLKEKSFGQIVFDLLSGFILVPCITVLIMLIIAVPFKIIF